MVFKLPSFSFPKRQEWSPNPARQQRRDDTRYTALLDHAAELPLKNAVQFLGDKIQEIMPTETPSRYHKGTKTLSRAEAAACTYLEKEDHYKDFLHLCSIFGIELKQHHMRGAFLVNEALLTPNMAEGDYTFIDKAKSDEFVALDKDAYRIISRMIDSLDLMHYTETALRFAHFVYSVDSEKSASFAFKKARKVWISKILELKAKDDVRKRPYGARGRMRPVERRDDARERMQADERREIFDAPRAPLVPNPQQREVFVASAGALELQRRIENGEICIDVENSIENRAVVIKKLSDILEIVQGYKIESFYKTEAIKSIQAMSFILSERGIGSLIASARSKKSIIYVPNLDIPIHILEVESPSKYNMEEANNASDTRSRHFLEAMIFVSNFYFFLKEENSDLIKEFLKCLTGYCIDARFRSCSDNAQKMRTALENRLFNFEAEMRKYIIDISSFFQSHPNLFSKRAAELGTDLKSVIYASEIMSRHGDKKFSTGHYCPEGVLTMELIVKSLQEAFLIDDPD